MLNSVLTLDFYNFLIANFAFTLTISICVSVAINIDAKTNNIQHRKNKY